MLFFSTAAKKAEMGDLGTRLAHYKVNTRHTHLYCRWTKSLPGSKLNITGAKFLVSTVILSILHCIYSYICVNACLYLRLFAREKKDMKVQVSVGRSSCCTVLDPSISPPV